MSIGATLAEARQQAGLSVAQLATRTKIRETVINAMERDDFSICGGDFYARGHLRALAGETGLDPDVLARQYHETYGGLRVPRGAASLFTSDTSIKLYERRAPNWTMAMGVAFAVVLVFGVVRAMGSAPEQQTKQAAAKAPAAAPAAAPKAPAPRQPATRPITAAADLVVLTISAKTPAWVNVRDATGNELFQGTIKGGDSATFQARKKIKLTVGNAGAVSLNVNGQELGTPGRSGQTVRRAFGPGVPRPR